MPPPRGHGTNYGHEHNTTGRAYVNRRDVNGHLLRVSVGCVQVVALERMLQAPQSLTLRLGTTWT